MSAEGEARYPDPDDFGGTQMPAMGHEQQHLDELWQAFGCASNPDAFKPSVREHMWEQVLHFARESQAADRRIVRDRDQVLAKLRAVLAVLDEADREDPAASEVCKEKVRAAILGGTS